MHLLIKSSDNASFYAQYAETCKGGHVVLAYKFIVQYGDEEMDKGNPSPRQNVMSAIRKY